MNRNRLLLFLSIALTQVIFISACAGYIGILDSRRTKVITEAASVVIFLYVNSRCVEAYYREHWHSLKGFDVMILVAGHIVSIISVLFLELRAMLEIGNLAIILSEILKVHLRQKRILLRISLYHRLFSG